MAFQNSNGDFYPSLVVNFEHLTIRKLQSIKKDNVVEIARFFNLGDEVCNSTKPKMIPEISKYIQQAEKEAKARAKPAAAIMQGIEAQEEAYAASSRSC